MGYDPVMAEADAQSVPESPLAKGLVDGDEVVPEGFDTGAYMQAYPDVAAAVRSGVWKSALDHYREHGERENRMADKRYLEAATGGSTASFPPSSVDRGFITRSGLCLVSGWVSDTDEAPLRQIVVRQNVRVVGATNDIARERRDDAQTRENALRPRLCGFWALLDLELTSDPQSDFELVLMAGEERRSFNVAPVSVDEEELRDIALRALVSAKYYADAETESFFQLDRGLGKRLINLNIKVTERIAAGAYRQDFGNRRQRYVGSLIIVLFGEASYLTLQAALFSQCRDYDQYEFIYVSNSLELSDTLIKDATNASKIYNIAITLILLPGNTGFGVASNVGAAAAQSDRIVFINPDVLPRDHSWVERHSALVHALPADQTMLFSCPLFYGDGSLMHGGMFLEIGGGCVVHNSRMDRREMLRVEHYGKGAHPETVEYLRARPVPAVSGAFISMNREWLEQLGGFSREFIFGHYEDVDLCLRSLQAGSPAWMHNIALWHLESKGSKHLPVHDGGRLVNRWHLTQKWLGFVKAELVGRSPAYFAR
jgi:GT2 family glycosyltransferase